MSERKVKSVEEFEQMGIYTPEGAAEQYFLQFYDTKKVKELMENFDPGSIGRPSDGSNTPADAKAASTGGPYASSK